jgi:hypothetical protein
MELLLILLVVLILLGGGYGYRTGMLGGRDPVSIVLFIILVIVICSLVLPRLGMRF